MRKPPLRLSEISDYFRGFVAERLAGDARIFASFSAGDIVIVATWRLRNDPHRPGKRSRPVRIVIPVDAVEAYVRGGDHDRCASERRFAAWLETQLAGFDADHDSPPGADPGVVTWKMDRGLLSGSTVLESQVESGARPLPDFR